MPFKRFVETGRVAYVADGPYRGKLCAIVDVIDQTRALVDGPETGVPRGQVRLSQLHLTKYKINFPFTDHTKAVRKSWIKDKIDEKWAAGMWAQKIAAKRKRRSMTDFDRFKLRKARQIRNKVRTLTYYRLRKRALRDRAKKSTEKKKEEPKEKKEAKGKGESKEKKEAKGKGESKEKKEVKEKKEPKQKKDVPKK